MASSVACLLIASAVLFTVTAGEDCKGYLSSSYQYINSKSCGFWAHCCGSCDNRYCCSQSHLKLSEYAQNLCVTYKKPTVPYRSPNYTAVVFSSISAGVVIFLLLICLCCPCCCLYKMCHKPRPVVGSNVAVVMNTQCIQQQPVMPGGQFSGYQPVPTQPGYNAQPTPNQPGYSAHPVPNQPGYSSHPVPNQPGYSAHPIPNQPGYSAHPVPNQPGYSAHPVPNQPSYSAHPIPNQPGYSAHPMQPGQYPKQPYAPGAPPPYHMAVSPGYPITQPAYDAGQAPYPMLAPPGDGHPALETSTQPAYNPAYVQPTKNSY